MIVRINAIDVPEGRGEELEARFAERVREVETMPGFLGFELLRPTGGDTRYFVYTRWESEEAFNNWVNSPAFRRGHAHLGKERGGPVAHGSEVLSFDVVQKVEAADASTVS
jgi:heme-degrading monooxygenase HmoA